MKHNRTKDVFLMLINTESAPTRFKAPHLMDNDLILMFIINFYMVEHTTLSCAVFIYV